MATEYTNVTIQDMHDFLSPQGFVKMNLKEIDPTDRTEEVVYGKRVDVPGHRLTLRLYTGINPDGNSRGVGADAMRVDLFTRKAVKNRDGQWEHRSVYLRGSKRVHRVKGWQKNLQDRIDKLDKNLEVCPKCGQFMVEVKGGVNGKFMGCLGFRITGCRFSKDIPKKGK